MLLTRARAAPRRPCFHRGGDVREPDRGKVQPGAAAGESETRTPTRRETPGREPLGATKSETGTTRNREAPWEGAAAGEGEGESRWGAKSGGGKRGDRQTQSERERERKSERERERARGRDGEGERAGTEAEAAQGQRVKWREGAQSEPYAKTPTSAGTQGGRARWGRGGRARHKEHKHGKKRGIEVHIVMSWREALGGQRKTAEGPGDLGER